LPLLLSVASLAAEESATYEPPTTCRLCAGELPVPVVALTPAWLDSVAQERARFNEAQIDRIDSLFKTGHYGPPKQPPARRMAHLVARLTLVNAYRDLVRLACDTTCVYEANEAVLKMLDGIGDAKNIPAFIKRVKEKEDHSVLFGFGKFGLGFYLGRSSIASSYGAAGSLVIIVLWVYYSSQTLFLGAEFTRVKAKQAGRLFQPARDAEFVTVKELKSSHPIAMHKSAAQ
jgi:hypothetical protein